MHRFDLYELRHLAPGAELSMGVVNARVKQLNARTASFLEQGVGVPALLCLPTYFMAKLVPDLLGGTLHSTKSHAAAKHCIRPELLRRQYCSPWASVLDCGLVLVPCHVPSVPNAVAFGRGAPVVGHWILLVADLDQQQIFVIDPMQVIIADKDGTRSAMQVSQLPLCLPACLSMRKSQLDYLTVVFFCCSATG
jgi:hypothetical protein